MDTTALTSLAGKLGKLGAPALGGVLKTVATGVGGPLVGAVAGMVIDALGDALGVDKTPEAVETAITAKPDAAAVIVRQVEAAQGNALSDELAARLADVKDARATTVKLVEQGSIIAWGAPVVSFMVMAAFGIFSYLAITSPVSGPAREVVMYLLGAWQGLAATVIAYWVGSSAGSASKEAVLNNLARRR